MRTPFAIAAGLAVSLALPALAQDTKDDALNGTSPTNTMTNQVPAMKQEAPPVIGNGADAANALPSTKAMSEAVPAMRPGDKPEDAKALPTAAASDASARTLSLTAEQDAAWIAKPIYSSDGDNVGEVKSFTRDAQNNVNGMHASMGGFLGIGQTSVKLTVNQFELQGDRVTLGITAAQVKNLPRAQI